VQPTFGQSSTVTPVLDCVVYHQESNALTAYFGYVNTSASTMHVDVGPNNFFSPGILFRNQPTDFLPGEHHRVFSTSFQVSASQPQITWFLQGSFVVAKNDTSLYCSPPTVFTYQGRLTDGGSPAGGQYDFQFRLFGGETEPAPLGSIEVGDVQVSAGVFSVQLDFGALPFAGAPGLFLEIGVRPGSQTSAYTILTPRQSITASPFGIYSGTVDHFRVLGTNVVAGTSNLMIGSNNTLVGINAFSGSSNNTTVIGSNAQAGDPHLGGANQSTVIGYNAKVVGDHSTAIGADAHANASNTIVLGSNVDTVDIPGNLVVAGSVSKGGGAFRIDHPLDPENKTLSHSFVESPDMMNIYNGNAILDKRGEAVIALPNYFEALNRDFRYQLTCIGSFAPVYVAAQIKANRFRIAGGRPGMTVSWQVTGIRKDAYANAHRIQVEQQKPIQEHGRSLHPDAFHESKAADPPVSSQPGKP